MPRSNRSRVKIGVLALLVVATTTVGACSSSSSGSKTTGSTSSGGSSGSTSGNSGSLAKAPGFDGKTITVGYLIPQSGPVAGAGSDGLNGAQAEFDIVNKAGGIDGKYQIKVKTYDTAYDPSKTVQGYNELAPQVAVFGEVLGTAPAQAILPLATKDQVTYVPGSGALSWWRTDYTLPVTSGYDPYAATVTSWYINTNGTTKKICSLAQDDDFGAAGTNGETWAIKTLKGTAGTAIKFPAGTPDFTAQVKQLQSAHCDAVMAVTVPSDTAKVLSTAAQVNFAPQWLFISESWDGSISTGPLKSYVASHVAIASDLPTPADTTNAGMTALTASLQASGTKDDGPNLVLGAAYGQAVVELLTKAVQLGDLSRTGIHNALTQLGESNLNGLTSKANYGPIASRTPGEDIRVFQPDTSNSFGIKVLAPTVSPNAATSLPLK